MKRPSCSCFIARRASGRWHRSLSIGGRGQAAEQGECVGGAGAGIGGVGEDRQAGVEHDLEPLVVELPLDESAAGYRAMDQRDAIKVLLRP